MIEKLMKAGKYGAWAMFGVFFILVTFDVPFGAWLFGLSIAAGVAVASLWLMGDALGLVSRLLSRWYSGYAAGVGALVLASMYWGWGLTSVERVKNVPKSVRDNPGAYRSHYRSYTRYHGGK